MPETLTLAMTDEEVRFIHFLVVHADTKGGMSRFVTHVLDVLETAVPALAPQPVADIAAARQGAFVAPAAAPRLRGAGHADE